MSAPSRVRYALLTVATANAFVLYLDRICMSAVVQSKSFQTELGLNKESAGDVLAIFFLAYALGQLPAGYLADRFGPRRMLVTYIVLWSLATAATGLTSTVTSLVAVRAACGLAEAGAYPASSLLISRWFPFAMRARANSVVAFGGRIGNSLALWLTAMAIAWLGSWRPVLLIYGLLGLGLAAATRMVFRDRPEMHPWVNREEVDLIGPPPPPKRQTFPWRALVTHRGLWMLNLGSLGLNFGWAFLITWLPNYLVEVRGLDALTSSRYVSTALAFSMLGMLVGGWWCDRLTARFGQKWGRRLPFLIGSAVATIAYLACPWLPGPLYVAAACGLVAFAADSVTPAIWTLAQDIGGQNVASTLAWSNMWGNFGASMVAKVIPLILTASIHREDWSEVFAACALGFVLLGSSACLVDSTRKLGD